MSDGRTERPGAFIFHVGRCGSTLLANMLAADGNRAVLKEPQAVSDVVAELLLAVDDGARHEAESALVSTIAALSAAERLREPPAFKFAAWNVRVAGVLLERFPNTPAVFLHRNPVETVASLVDVPPGWRGLIACPRSVQACFFPTLRDVPADASLSWAEFYAHGWSSNVEAALALRADRVAFVGYRELSHDPRRALDGILAALEIESSAAALAVMTGAGRTYSKDANDRRPFDPKGAHRRPPLPPEDERHVRAITASRVEELERRRPQTTNQL